MNPLKFAGFLPKLFAQALYRSAYKLHHALFLRPGKPLDHARLAIVGSYLVGGAGKTPFCAWLAQFLNSTHAAGDATTTATTNAAIDTAATDAAGSTPRIAILCHAKAQDEAKMLREKLPFVTVIATSNRYTTAHEIDSEFDYIICDDGFEDTRLTGAVTMLLDWQIPCDGIRDLIPAGPCRSLAKDHDTPTLSLRCTGDGSSSDKDVRFSIEKIVNSCGIDLRDEIANGKQALRRPILVTGLGNGNRFENDLLSAGVAPSEKIFRRDHDPHFEKIILSVLKRGNPVVVSEKDKARLTSETAQNPQIFVARQKTEVSAAAKTAIGKAILRP